MFIIMYSNILEFEESREMGLLPSYWFLFIVKAISVTGSEGPQG
jgi:hypothetical protein